MARYANLVAMLAVTADSVLGYQTADGKEHLPFDRLEGDMARVKRLTTHNAIVIGRKTWDGTHGPKGKVFPLPNRDNYVMSRSKEIEPTGGVLCRDVSQILIEAKRDPETIFFIFGGAEIYNAFEAYVNQAVVTIAKDPISDERLAKAVSVTEYSIDNYMRVIDDVKPYSNNTVYLTSFKDSVPFLLNVSSLT